MDAKLYLIDFLKCFVLVASMNVHVPLFHHLGLMLWIGLSGNMIYGLQLVFNYKVLLLSLSIWYLIVASVPA